MKRCAKLLTGLLALGAGVGGARAAILTTPTVSAGPYMTDVFNNPGNIVDLPLFNSNLGTLIGVSVSETGTFTASALLTNEAPQEEIFDFHIEAQFGVNLQSNDLPGNATTALAATVFNPALPQVNYDLPKAPGPGNADGYGRFTASWGGIITGLPAADFEGPGGGTVALHIDGISNFVDSPKVIENNDVAYAPFFFDSTGPTGTASLFAIYRYTPARGIPEPSTWAMMLLGFIGLASVGWRAPRRASAAAG